jgi:tetratricopeptide (TPR) repeat protein
LLHAANRCLEAGDSVKAREIFERLVAVDPKDTRSRLRLAETRAAAGESTEAAEEFVGLARVLLDRDEPDEAAKLYLRAAELLPDSHLPPLGLARCLKQQGQAAEALALLEQTATRKPVSGAVVGELALSYDAVGRPEAALEVLTTVPFVETPLPVWSAILKGFALRGAAVEAWRSIDPLLAGVTDRSRLGAALETLTEIDGAGHVPALERLVAVRKELNDREGTLRALQDLACACDASSLCAEAARARADAALLKAPSPPPPSPPKAAPEVPAPSPVKRTRPVPRPVPARVSNPIPPDLAPEIEAPAVPLNRADEEFVAGRLTQAEVLDKYGMQAQALEQVEEVTSRYPGHVRAQESRVSLLRALGRPLAEALVQLAVARRAEGDVPGAQEAVKLAAEGGPLPPSTQRMLSDLGLVESVRPSVAAPAASPASEADDDAEIDLVIDLEEDGDELALPLVAEQEAEAEPQPVTAAALPAPRAGNGEDADLRAIAEALESELFDEEPLQPEEDPKLAMKEILTTFRERVAQEVAGDDFRTHYDLGIAYKEMGLVDEAIQEFESAARSPQLRRDACVMIAVCHRDRCDLMQAARWYRQALDSMDGAPGGASDLRYDLAEALLGAGDAAAALEEFRGLLQVDPTFRDVGGRIHELESELTP